MDIQTIREIYAKAAENEEFAEKLYNWLRKQDLSTQPIWLAYLGAAEALKAKNTFFPLAKLDYIQQAQTTLAKAIKLAPNDIEIRFLRFTIEANTPFFLGLSTHIEQDKLLIINNIRHSPTDLAMKQAIVDFLLKSGLCQEEEIEQLKTF